MAHEQSNFSFTRIPRPRELVEPPRAFLVVYRGEKVGIFNNPRQFDMQQLLHTPNFAMRQFMEWGSAVAFYTACFDTGEVCILNLRGEVVARSSKRIDGDDDSDIEIVSVSFAGDTRANPINVFTLPKRRKEEPTEEELARERRRKHFREYQAGAQAKAFAKSSAATRIVPNGQRSKPLYEDEDGVGVIEVPAAGLRGAWIETEGAGPFKDTSVVASTSAVTLDASPATLNAVASTSAVTLDDTVAIIDPSLEREILTESGMDTED